MSTDCLNYFGFAVVPRMILFSKSQLLSPESWVFDLEIDLQCHDWPCRSTNQLKIKSVSVVSDEICENGIPTFPSLKWECSECKASGRTDIDPTLCLSGKCSIKVPEEVKSFLGEQLESDEDRRMMAIKLLCSLTLTVFLDTENVSVGQKCVFRSDLRGAGICWTRMEPDNE